MAEVFHISSLIVRTLPGSFDDISAALTRMPDTDIYQSDPRGKIVVVLETDDEDGIASRLSAIEALPGVLNASLIYHHIEETVQDTEKRL